MIEEKKSKILVSEREPNTTLTLYIYLIASFAIYNFVLNKFYTKQDNSLTFKDTLYVNVFVYLNKCV